MGSENKDTRTQYERKLTAGKPSTAHKSHNGKERGMRCMSLCVERSMCVLFSEAERKNWAQTHTRGHTHAHARSRAYAQTYTHLGDLLLAVRLGKLAVCLQARHRGDELRHRVHGRREVGDEVYDVGRQLCPRVPLGRHGADLRREDGRESCGEAAMKPCKRTKICPTAYGTLAEQSCFKAISQAGAKRWAGRETDS